MSKKSKRPLRKHTMLLKLESDQDFLIKFLIDKAEFLESKFEIIPEEIDANCINFTGMRLNLLIDTLAETSFRVKFVKKFGSCDPLVYIPKIEIGKNALTISKENHKDFISLTHKLNENKEGLASFVDYFQKRCEVLEES